VHLSSPGWNVVGATAPWLPGVSIGHNDHIAWGHVPVPADTQDIFVEHVNPGDPHQVEWSGRWVDMDVDFERIAVKGRAAPFEYERLYTSNGVVIALDRERHLAYTLKWSGTEPGAAAGLAALAVDRARTWDEFREALSHWKMPLAAFVYADVDGHIGRAQAGLIPVRATDGRLPVAGWVDGNSWRGWQDPGNALAQIDLSSGLALAADPDGGRVQRISEIFRPSVRATIDDVRRGQLDVQQPHAEAMITALRRIEPVPTELAAARDLLVSWDRRVIAGSAAAQLYLRWERALGERVLGSAGVPREFVAELVDRIDIARVVDGPLPPVAGADRNALLIESLRSAVAGAGSGGGDARTGTPQQTSGAPIRFEHPLAIFDAARRRFNVGPVRVAGGSASTVLATDGATGPVFRAIFDPGDWSRSLVVNAPGQSGVASSPHYDDMTGRWANGQLVPLMFEASKIDAGKVDVLTLVPASEAPRAK
jgi:penicillin amidase